MKMRPLATGAISFALAILVSNYILGINSLLLSALICAATAVVLLCFKRRWLRGAIICLFSMALGFGCYFAHYNTTTVPAQKLAGQTLEFEAYVLTYPTEYDDYVRTEVKIQIPGYPKLRTIVYADPGDMDEVKPGDYVRLTAKLRSSELRYGKEYDYYRAKDIYLSCSAKSEIEVTGHRTGLYSIAAEINYFIAETVDKIYPEDAAPFMKSLLLGDKKDFYEDQSLDIAISHAGFSHVIAVSGMHVAFLVALLQMLLGRGAKSSLFSIAVIWLFVLVTGSSPSAIRAAFLQTLLLTAPLVKRETDPITSLSAALAVILLFNPYAIASVSLQLSFLSVAGLIFFSEKLNGFFLSFFSKELGKKLKYPIGIAAASLSVTVLTGPLVAIYFGYQSLVSPLVNILGLWAVSVSFVGGYISCGLSLVLPFLSKFAAAVIAWPVRYILTLCRVMSSFEYSVIYFKDEVMTGLMIFCYLLFIIVAVLKLDKRVKLFLPVTVTVLCVVFASGFARYRYEKCAEGYITVIDVGQGQCISAFSGDKTVVIDCGSVSSLDNSGETANAYLKSCGRERIDLLVLTHLHSDHANGAAYLLEVMDVERLVLPADPVDNEGFLQEILAVAEERGTRVEYISADRVESFGGMELQIYKPGDAGGANERCIMARLSFGDYDMLVTADGPMSAERELMRKHDVSGTELLIVGHHGSKYSCCPEIIETTGAETAVISVGDNNYGHPTEEVLDRLEQHGCEIYRTDLDGDVEFRLGA